MDYKNLGFKCGVEIHNRLATNGKLFCNCKASFSDKKHSGEVIRKLRAVAGETGEVDVAAVHEYLKNKSFVYNSYDKESCLVETDSEPPHGMNKEALEIGLQISKMLKAEIPDEIHVMRKTVVDGSNTSGFQRTALVGMNGILKTSKGDVRISNISIEEESSGIVEKGKNSVFRLDRLGIPLVEIGTEPDIVDPEHALEVAEKIGMIVRSTGKSQRGIGVTRQDVNVSIKGGARVEIKGFQELSMIPKIIEEEIKRQQQLIIKGEKPKEETRMAKLNGKTEFMRPLPGGGRMYPETDIEPIVVTRDIITKLVIPETWDKKLVKFKKILPGDMANQILKSEYLQLFENYSKEHDPVLVASVFTSTIKDLRRKGFDVNKITYDNFEDVFNYLAKKKIAKEAIPTILENFSKNPNIRIEEMGFESAGSEDVRKIIKGIIEKNPDVSFGGLMGDVMKELKGRASGQEVKKILEEELKKK